METFGASSEALGYQVFRPEFDRVLLERAAAAGADVRAGARVGSVSFGDDSAAVEYDEGGRRSAAACRIVLDCSGRAGVVGRRFRVPQPGHRMVALVGVWNRSGGWDLPDDSHTVVETYRDGWAWSVPLSRETRHIGAMVGAVAADERNARALGEAYQAEIAKTTQLNRRLDGAALDTCGRATRHRRPRPTPVRGSCRSATRDRSSIRSRRSVEGAASRGSPRLSPDAPGFRREAVACEFFSGWERRVYATHLARSRDFARAACAADAAAFWTPRAETTVDAPAEADDVDVSRDPDVQRAFEAFKAKSSIDLTMADGVRFEPRPFVRVREIVLEEALAGGLRFVGHVDLVTLARMACEHRHVPDLFDAYCQSCAPVPLPSFVSGLSLLVARGILHERT